MAIMLGVLMRLYVEANSDVILIFHDKSLLTLKDYIYVAKMKRNIILTYCMSLWGRVHTNLSDNASIKKNDKEVYQVPVVNGTYVLHPKALVEPPNQEVKLNEKSIINKPTSSL